MRNGVDDHGCFAGQLQDGLAESFELLPLLLAKLAGIDLAERRQVRLGRSRLLGNRQLGELGAAAGPAVAGRWA
jgi:hypothetical protein